MEVIFHYEYGRYGLIVTYLDRSQDRMKTDKDKKELRM